jgi:hypothetical protein
MTDHQVDRKPRRWGVRTLFFLVLAVICILASTLQGHYTLLTLAGLVVGLGGAMVCSVRGLATLSE